MDAKFLAVLILVECAALVFNIFHLRKKTFDLYANYDESPKILNISNVNYQCFTSMKHCHYETGLLYKFNVPHCIFIILATIGYFILFYIVVKRKQDLRLCGTEYSLYNTTRLLVLLMTCLNTLLLCLHYNDEENIIGQCGLITYVTRIENLSTYIIINVLEGAYLSFDFMHHRHQPYYEHNLNANPGEGHVLINPVHALDE